MLLPVPFEIALLCHNLVVDDVFMFAFHSRLVLQEARQQRGAVDAAAAREASAIALGVEACLRKGSARLKRRRSPVYML